MAQDFDKDKGSTRTVVLTSDLSDAAFELGDGNFSEGIRRAIRIATETVNQQGMVDE